MLSKTGLRLAMSALGIVFGLAGGATYAEGTKTVINAATEPTIPPFTYKDLASNKLMGFDIDLFEAIAAKMGAKVNWIDTKYQEFIPAIKTKRVDVAVAQKEDTPEGRTAGVSFVDYVNDGSVFVTLRANAERFPDMDVLCGKRVGATRSSDRPVLVAKWSDEHCTKAGNPAVIVVGTEHSADSRLQINQGRIDAFTFSPLRIGYQNKIENNRYMAIGKPFHSFPNGIVFANDDPQFGQAIKNALGAVMADGTYRDLLRKWDLPDDGAIERPMINGQP
ncbi:transporter substrate-binding domain-containing protein [Bradyrhizobium sp. Pha-3]|uniref:transporter substrate-binding domain-containing protein n=1 Tax=Bradyrhizobium sp. Pha-3 TaxID=208375 RepID=UPI0035D4A82B